MLRLTKNRMIDWRTSNGAERGNSFPSSEVEAIAHLAVDLARIVVVKASEGEAVVQQPARVGNVLCIDGDRPIFTDRLTHRQVRGYVAGQIGTSVGRGRVRIAVGKSRTVIDVERGIELI